MLSKNEFSPINPKFPVIFYGADYNPEQWSQDIWQEDIRLMKLAGVNIVTLGVFSWSQLQPDENEFDFDWLDKIISMLEDNKIYIALATPTAAQPAWMSQKYPEVLRSDAYGLRKNHGKRINYCPNSKIYRKFAAQITKKLAVRYKDLSNLAFWHISNEYSGQCFCENCAFNFRKWLKEKYCTLEELNKRWYNKFWSHTYTDWQQISPPYKNGETQSSSLSLDYLRFMDESMLACFKNEADIVRRITPKIPVTTNMMGPRCKEINSRNWSKHLDVAAWDSYPLPKRSNPANIAFRHNCMRAVKDGQPFLLMEQAPSNKLWASVLTRKEPGLMRLWSYQAIAHGADSIMFFQWRRSLGGCEKLHSAIIESDKAEYTRVFNEISQLGSELQKIGDKLIGSFSCSEVGLIFDWGNYWAADLCEGPLENKCYVQTIQKYHQAFFERNIPIDIIFPDSEFSKFKIIIAPMLYMLNDKLVKKINSFVENGGIFVTTSFSGIANEEDILYSEGFLGPLQKLAGIWVEEIDALYDDQFKSICLEKTLPNMQTKYQCSKMCDTIQTTTAETLALYGESWQKGTPVVTVNSVRKGKVYYIGTVPDHNFLSDFSKYLSDLVQVKPLLETPKGVEVFSRHSDKKEFLFILNHTDERQRVSVDRTVIDILTGEKFCSTINLKKKRCKNITNFSIIPAYRHRYKGIDINGANPF